MGFIEASTVKFKYLSDFKSIHVSIKLQFTQHTWYRGRVKIRVTKQMLNSTFSGEDLCGVDTAEGWTSGIKCCFYCCCFLFKMFQILVWKGLCKCLALACSHFFPWAPCLTRTNNHLAFVWLCLLMNVVTMSILTEVSLRYIPFRIWR